MHIKYIAVLLFTVLLVKGKESSISVLVFSKTESFRHKSIPAGKQFLTEMASKNNWEIQFSVDELYSPTPT